MSKTKTEFTACKLANVERALADHRHLTRLDFWVLYAFASSADWRSEISRCRQTDVAKLLGCTTRAVRKCLDRLVEFEYLKPIGAKPGKNISAYNVLGAKSGTCVPVAAAVDAGNGKAERAFHKEERAFQKEERPFAHSTFNPLVIPSDQRDTEPGALRERANALRAPPDGETGKRLSNGHAVTAELEPPTPNRPFPEKDAAIRTLLARIAGNSRLYAGSRTMEFDGRSILIQCPTDGMASELRPFADEIADDLGLDQVRFAVAHGPGLRKMQ